MGPGQNAGIILNELLTWHHESIDNGDTSEARSFINLMLAAQVPAEDLRIVGTGNPFDYAEICSEKGKDWKSPGATPYKEIQKRHLGASGYVMANAW